MFRNGQISSMISYLKYEPNEVQGVTRHRDIDSIYCSALVFPWDTYNECLHVEGYNLPDIMYPGDVLFMDPRQIHEVTECSRSKARQVLVFTT